MASLVLLAALVVTPYHQKHGVHQCELKMEKKILDDQSFVVFFTF